MKASYIINPPLSPLYIGAFCFSARLLYVAAYWGGDIFSAFAVTIVVVVTLNVTV
ncbi:hypothetical protein [Bacteroides thetaiotaomicron]|uniref:hypothetical protein n=1 Tax=Bacteroides thetaiotaomicron TaxID=818 RepID=UPI0036F195BC